jgi:hypothetical protein
MDPTKRPDPSLRQSKTALLEAAQAAIADRKTKAGTGPPPGFKPQRSRTPFRSVLVLFMAVGTGVLVAQPSWLVGPRLPKETEAVQAASATLALVEAVSHVKAFAAATGRLPTRLTDAGVSNQAITFRPLAGEEFEVSLQAGDRLIALRSTDSLKAIVVNAIVTLQRRT